MGNRSKSRAPAAIAAELDGSKDIICAVNNAVACTKDDICLQGGASSFDLPEFVIIDAKRKVVRGTHGTEQDPASPIKSMERNGNHLILQGIENGRGWDVAVDTKTGKMSAAVVGDAISILAFGACMAP